MTNPKIMPDTNPKFISNLSEISHNYKFILCDIWGVMHNGVSAFNKACDALCNYRDQGGKVALITNAPRPSKPILEQLNLLGVPQNAYDTLVTSGDVTHSYLSNWKNRKVYHIGPSRDLTLFNELGINLVDSHDAELIVCTGLFNDVTETPDEYRENLENFAERELRFLCANPDITVLRGDKMIWCAGGLAKLYEELGGTVDLLGKPHSPIYDLALKKLSQIQNESVDRSSILAIGDGLPTDIKGANTNNFDVLFITGGIHSSNFGAADSPVESKVLDLLNQGGYKITAAMPELVW